MLTICRFVVLAMFAGSILMVSCRRDSDPGVHPEVVQSYTYHDFSPDIIFSSSANYGEPRVPYDSTASVEIDVDGDSQNDFLFSTSHFHTYYPPSMRECYSSGIILLDTTRFQFMVGHPSIPFILLIDSGEVFGPHYTDFLHPADWYVWGTYNSLIDIHYDTPESPPSQPVNGIKYIGFEKIVGNDVYYGWIQFSKPNDLTIKIYACAIGNVPDLAIVAGEH